MSSSPVWERIVARVSDCLKWVVIRSIRGVNTATDIEHLRHSYNVSTRTRTFAWSIEESWENVASS